MSLFKITPLFQKYITGTLLLLLFSNIVAAQSDSLSNYKKAKNPYSHRAKFSVLPFGIGVVSTSNHSENLNVRFPYQTTDASGITTSHVFNGNTNHLFSNKSPEILFGFDITRPHFAINFSTGVNTSYKGAFYAAGFGINLYLGYWNSSFQDKIKKCTWVLRPSLNVAYFSFSSGTIGEISNTHTNISVLGSDADSTFTYLNVPSFNPKRYKTSFFKSYEMDANKLIVTYKQQQIGIQPKLALCTNPYKKNYCIQIFASYFIPLAQSGGLVLRQYNDEYERREFVSGMGKNNLNDHKEISVTYNNHSFGSVPFRANNIFIGIVFGFTFSN